MKYNFETSIPKNEQIMSVTSYRKVHENKICQVGAELQLMGSQS